MTQPYVVCLPAMDPTRAMRCLASMARPMFDRTLVVDNSPSGAIDQSGDRPRWCARARLLPDGTHNQGVPVSWNAGISAAETYGAEWLILLSEAVEFGPAGGLDLLSLLHAAQHPVVHGQTGWHCIAIRRIVWRTVGVFDPVFSPAYFEDTDYLYRMGLAGLPSPRENGGELCQATLDLTDHGFAGTLTSGRVKVSMGEQEAKYVAKWGGVQGAEKFVNPYDNPALDWRHTGGPR